MPLLPTLLLLGLGILVDCYLYRRMRAWRAPRLWCKVYMAVAAVCSLTMAVVFAVPKLSVTDTSLSVLMWTLFAYISIYLPKYIMAIFAAARQLLSRLTHRSMAGITWTGMAVSAVVFGVMWWGALVNRFNIDVKEVDVRIENLPEAFDGYRIVQISDIHTGSFSHNTDFLKRIADAVEQARPDIVLFTGDIVNRHSSELKPFTGQLGTVTAPDGVWSVLGNHDYGDYYAWPDSTMKQADVDSLRMLQRSMGWNVLDNSHTVVRRGADSIVVIGVENIGDPPFKVLGDLDKAYPRLNDGAVKILMSHNPRHWTDSIANRPGKDIALTLAGHTHAMQMSAAGISPAVFRYPTWGGMYTDSLGRNLYVNIGLGEVGFPARIGATPEITVITLRR